MTEETKQDKSIVQSLAKGFQVLQTFTSDEPELVLAEVARRSGLDKGTTFRLLNTLVMLGYVDRVEGTRNFRLTFRCLDLGFNAIARSELRTQARPVLRNLVGQTSEAASIGVLDGSDVVYVERIQAGLVRLAVDVRIGSRAPVYSTAMGHAIIAFLPEATQVDILESAPRPKRTDSTVTDLGRLLKRLRATKKHGYAVSNQENVSGLCVIAAPILDLDGAPLAAVSVAAPTMRITPEEFESLAVKPLLDAAQQLSRVLQVIGGATFEVVRK
ncbi:MAG: IclR family transcriptional regulator [Proteobacteria bacterium]|nr:IclR family transcriptional regulator [Pseudomonadota bacterium]